MHVTWTTAAARHDLAHTRHERQFRRPPDSADPQEVDRMLNQSLNPQPLGAPDVRWCGAVQMTPTRRCRSGNIRAKKDTEYLRKVPNSLDVETALVPGGAGGAAGTGRCPPRRRGIGGGADGGAAWRWRRRRGRRAGAGRRSPLHRQVFLTPLALSRHGSQSCCCRMNRPWQQRPCELRHLRMSWSQSTYVPPESRDMFGAVQNWWQLM